MFKQTLLVVLIKTRSVSTGGPDWATTGSALKDLYCTELAVKPRLLQ